MRINTLICVTVILLAACQTAEKKTADSKDTSKSQAGAPSSTQNTTEGSTSAGNTQPAINDNPGNNAGARAVPKEGASAVEIYGRYGIKSGHVEMKSTQDIGKDYHYESTVDKVFDNYGRDEYMEVNSVTDAGGNKKVDKERMLMRSGWLHNLRADFIAARQHPYTQFTLDNMEFSLLDADAMHLYNIKNMGYQNIDGHNCVHYYIDYHDKEHYMKGDMWTYKNLFYGMDVNMNETVIHSKVTRLEENIAVDQSKFDIPSGYRVIDADNLE